MVLPGNVVDAQVQRVRVRRVNAAKHQQHARRGAAPQADAIALLKRAMEGNAATQWTHPGYAHRLQLVATQGLYAMWAGSPILVFHHATTLCRQHVSGDVSSYSANKYTTPPPLEGR